jgi:hypothetical protein
MRRVGKQEPDVETKRRSCEKDQSESLSRESATHPGSIAIALKSAKRSKVQTPQARGQNQGTARGLQRGKDMIDQGPYPSENHIVRRERASVRNAPVSYLAYPRDDLYAILLVIDPHPELDCATRVLGDRKKSGRCA